MDGKPTQCTPVESEHLSEGEVFELWRALGLKQIAPQNPQDRTHISKDSAPITNGYYLYH